MPLKLRKTVSKQLGEAALGDMRRSKRLERVAEAIADRPAASLPKAMGNDVALEGAYRLLSNPEVTPEGILKPHFAETAARAEAAKKIYGLGDTSEFQFAGEGREGLGPLQHGQGFLAHVCLAVAADGSRLPLGLLALETWARPEQKKSHPSATAARQSPDRESLKWSRVALAAEAVVAGRCQVIHVMDREADIYELLVTLQEQGHHFIIRVAQDRMLASDEGRLFPALENAAAQVLREVPLSRRKWKTKQHPVRAERRARLSVSSGAQTLRRPKTADASLPASVTLKFVHVFEAEPPEGETAVDWKLVTTEPIKTTADLEEVIDGYRTRWVVEEFFKALKTGCAMEQSQLESLEALLNLLAIKMPIAAQILALRSMAETNEKAPAASILSPQRLEVLQAMSRQKLSANPTAQEALLAIAALGGHLKNNGPPGWQILWSGLDDLLRYEAAWVVLRGRAAM